MDAIDVCSEFQRVLRLEADAITQCANRLQQPQCAVAVQNAVEMIRTSLDQGGKIIVTGIGKSGKIGQKIAATLSSTGSLAVYLHPTEGLHGDLGIVSPVDTIIALSYSGNTEEIIHLLPALKNRGVSLIGMGGNAQSKLAQASQIWLDAAVEQEACPHNLAPTTSSTLMLALGDALAVTLMQLRGFDTQAFAKNHPAGSIGKKLNLKVKDLMHSGTGAATLEMDASMDEVVMALTEKRQGAVLIVQEMKLMGLITEGDLRRALRHREKFFKMKASDIMNAQPITVTPEISALEALRLMEKRETQINVLPVTGPGGKWVGLIRLHDIVQHL